MAVHSDAVRLPEAGLDDLLGIMALTKAATFSDRYARLHRYAFVETMLRCSIGKFDQWDAAMR